MKKHAIVADRSRPAGAKPSADKPPQPLVGAHFVFGAAAIAQLPPPGAPEIAFAGRSNVGKSSAINALAAQTRLAFASRTPGRTQQINFFALRGGAMVADLPGYGYAAVPLALKQAWQDFLWQYVTSRDTLVGLVVVVDARHGVRQPDVELLSGFDPSTRPVLVLATKVDKLNNAERHAAVRSMTESLQAHFATNMISVLPFSATKRIGIADANSVIASWLPA